MKLIDPNLKPVIDALPGSKVRPLSVAIHYCEQTEEPTLVGYLKMLEFVIENGLRLVEEETYVRAVLVEDEGGAPTNSVAGVQPTDEPVIDGATKKNKKNMDTRKAYGDLFSRKAPAA